MHKQPTSDTRYISKNGRVTERFKRTLERVLGEYIKGAKFFSRQFRKPSLNYTIKEASIVGSTLEGSNDSDLDILLIANNIDMNDYRIIKQYLSSIFFCNRPKKSAIDVFVRSYDEFPEKVSFEITGQVGGILNKYNKKLIS